MKTIMILGSGGMAGHMIGQFFFEEGYKVVGFGLRENKLISFLEQMDVSNLLKLSSEIDRHVPDAIINCVGILNQFADQNRERAVFLNSYLPHWLVKKTQNTTTKIIHISTDCVFSGKRGLYKEDDFHDGETFYDRTKSIGEVGNCKDITLRQSIIGPDLNMAGIGLLNWYLSQSGVVNGFLNSFWNGVTTLQLARGIAHIIDQGGAGLSHYVSSTVVSKFELLNMFNSSFPFSRAKVVPFNNTPEVDKSLSISKASQLLEVPSYSTMLSELNTWIQNHRNFYPHYFM